ncbi:50S ribosomal protein L22 [Candidatus Saccharibacteria bacterium]|nr:50S ribosomal protein L22 [Candidatus Saccharibacteria bacterium]
MADTLTTTAVARGVDQTPRKAGEVASLVRGRTVADALVILEHTPRRAAKAVAKVVASAKANALNNDGIDEKSLVIHEITVTAGTRLKRYRAGAMGRAKPYQKKTSHITVVVSGDPKIKKAPVKADKEPK